MSDPKPPGRALQQEGVSLLGDSVAAFIGLVSANMERVERRGGGELMLSPMEMKLAEAMHELGLVYEMQWPVGHYNADFYFPEALLCVEVDGKHHQGRRAQDARRDEFFAERGIRTLRFPGIRVHRDAFRCAAIVRDVLAEIDVTVTSA